MSNNLVNIAKYIKHLYQNGEYPFTDEINYLVKENLLIRLDNKFIISASWINLSHQLGNENFLRTLLAVNPEMIMALLVKTKSYAVEIALMNDKKEVFDFVDSLPFFANKLIDLKDAHINQEDSLQYLFNGNMSYQSMIRLLKNIQLIKKTETMTVQPLSDEPDYNWINGRIVSTLYPSERPDSPNRFVLTKLDIISEKISPETKAILTQPWETFLVIIGMIKMEYRIENEDGFFIKPGKPNNAMEEQDVLVTLSSQSGKVKEYGNLNAFAAELCTNLGIFLFPGNEPHTDIALFALLRRSVFVYNVTEYLLSPEWEDRIYNKERFLKNKSRSLKKNLRSAIDKLRSEI